MSTAYFSIAPALAPFLRPRLRGPEPVTVSFVGRQSVKHLVEALGVPHTEIGEVLVNGVSAVMSRITEDQDRIGILEAVGKPAGPPRFILDCHLGRLAAYLRMLGLDSAYRSDFDDDEVMSIAVSEQRILLTRDRRLLMHKVIREGYSPRSLEPLQQLAEVVHRFQIDEEMMPFTRCMHCNQLLQPAPKASVLEQLEPLTARYFDEFSVCPGCHKVYWKGSHHEKMQAIIKDLRGMGGLHEHPNSAADAEVE
jgi:hypothetical protein